MRRLRYVLILYGLLSVADWVLTMQAIESGIAHEANPFMALIIARGGWGMMLADKLAAFAFITIATHVLYRIGQWFPEPETTVVGPVGRTVAWIGVGFASTGQAVVVALNIAHLV
jgi:hypothetical protein